MIRPAHPADAQSIVDIYNPYIKDTTITFEEAAVSEEEMSLRIDKVTANYPWIVWEEDGKVLGYAYGSTWRTRNAYRFAVESAIYVAKGQERRGIGIKLYQALIEELRERGYHSVLGCLGLPNEPSVALHEKLGFTKVGHMKEAGWKFERWVDVGFWELML
jgi:L-amino acid N-acyltransferase YncA